MAPPLELTFGVEAGVDAGAGERRKRRRASLANPSLGALNLFGCHDRVGAPRERALDGLGKRDLLEGRRSRLPH